MKKILLIKRGAMGDILMSTPLIRQLRNHLPDSQIDYCLASEFVPVLEKNPYLTNVIPLEDSIFRTSGVFKCIKFILSICNKYDYIFILGKSWQFNLLTTIFSGITIGYAREAISKVLLNKYIIYKDVFRYHGLYYLDLLKISGLGIPNYDDLLLDLYISASDMDFVNTKILELKLDKFDIVVNSGGNNQYEFSGIRMLPLNKFNELINKLLKKNHQVVLLGSSLDRKYYENNVAISSPHLYNLAGIFSLAQSMYLLSKAHHFYTTDCGAMHLGVAANLGSKMTCFFGPTCPSHVLPPNIQSSVIWNDQEIFDKNYPLKGKLPKNYLIKKKYK